MMREVTMIYQELDPRQYAIGPSNGTTAVPQVRLGGEDTFIAVESVAMLGEISLRDAPSRTRLKDKPQVRPEVSAILERSLKEHAATWAELSKY
jgi:hypothetical protein